ncbi:Hypothetical predicted protein [Podarcis lilfordi]|uniref:Spermatogenesis associated 46 n=1 Tax=Podarcis lilfordi TaxID=74358 RepID=A0AA35KFG1_9SAUR|nr:Hypothetical predicted protein [Podarcis lilfordi]
MENFSLLTISGPRLPSFALKSVPDLTCPVHKSSLPGTLGGNSLEVPADTGPAGDNVDSGSSSSGSLEKTYPQERSSSRKATDCITSQDILLASKWRPPHGCQCVACCRMFPTLRSLKAHIKRGAREGFSCQVYYHKLKALWGKERKWRPSNRPAGSHKMLK